MRHGVIIDALDRSLDDASAICPSTTISGNMSHINFPPRDRLGSRHGACVEIYIRPRQLRNGVIRDALDRSLDDARGRHILVYAIIIK